MGNPSKTVPLAGPPASDVKVGVKQGGHKLPSERGTHLTSGQKKAWRRRESGIPLASRIRGCTRPGPLHCVGRSAIGLSSKLATRSAVFEGSIARRRGARTLKKNGRPSFIILKGRQIAARPLRRPRRRRPPRLPTKSSLAQHLRPPSRASLILPLCDSSAAQFCAVRCV